MSNLNHLPNYKFSYLTLSDQTLLGNVFNAYESTCFAAKSTQYPEFPSRKHKHLFSFLNEYSAPHKVLIEYVKTIPEFAALTINDKICLIRNQFGVVNNINEAIIHPGITTNLVISLSNCYGIKLANLILRSIERISPFTYDPMILKLLLVIVSLNTGNIRNRIDTDMDQICNDVVSIFCAQNIYVELLWKYILSRSPSEMDAVKFLDKLVQFLIHLLGVHLSIDGYINSLYDEVERMNPLMQSMWPKPYKTQIIYVDKMDTDYN